MRDYHAHFKNGHFYHIYNRANGSEKLFREKENCLFFLRKWEKYILNHSQIWAYVLIPNHFHFLIRITSASEEPNLNSYLEQQFKRLFSSYTLAFNKRYERNGSLFQKSFKRVNVDSEIYLQHLIHYIHHNPIHHKLVDDYADWKFSSFSSILSTSASRIYRKGVLDLFRGKENFSKYHREMLDYKNISHLLAE